MKIRRLLILIVILSLVFFTIAGCGSEPNEEKAPSQPSSSERQDSPSQPDEKDEENDKSPSDEDETSDPGEKGDTSVLVAYFSCTNKTKGVAQKIAQATGGTLYEIIPKTPYTAADLNYNSDCRANREQHDSSARPEIAGTVENMEQYDVVFLGYPIWWGEEPRIIDTFLESYDFSDKTIVPFCTSGGSGISTSENNLHAIASGANWRDAMRFVSTVSQNEVNEWAEPFPGEIQRKPDGGGNEAGKREEPVEGPSTPEDSQGDSKTETSQSDKAYTMSEDGKIIYFGSYPQSQAKERDLIEKLDAASETKEWTYYNDYIGGEVSEFMCYVDVEFQSARYRGVRFSSFRPNDTRSESSESRSYQDDNGYALNQTYWFRYEPLSWRVLEKSDGSALIVSEKVLDSHEFFPAAKGDGENKANDYRTSSIRQFLNADFYKTAFSERERTNLFGDDDKLFLLSYEEATNAAFFSSDEERALEATDYAKAQGLNMSGGPRWWLQSSNDRYDFYARYVDGGGFAEYNQYVYFTSLGVVPALRIKLFDEDGAQEEEETTDEIFLSINHHKVSVKLEQNAATEALIELLKEGDIIYSASDYGGFEKVGNLGHSLPRSDAQTTTEAGDVVLYAGNQIVLFYGSNAWSYTKLGRIQGLSAEEWREILTETNPITVKISLK